MEQFEKFDFENATLYMGHFNSYYFKYKNTQRLGQMAYNTLNELCDTAAIAGTHADPYYLDTKMPAFIDTVFAPDCINMMREFFAKYQKS